MWTRSNDRDLSRDRAKRFPSMKMYPTIAEALTLGGSKLAVDGIVVIGEHGKYPRNEKGQTQYPRYEFFQEIFKVLRVKRPRRADLQRQAFVVEVGMGEGDVRHGPRTGRRRSWPGRACR